MTDNFIARIRAAQIRAAEDAVVASLPQALRDNMARADAEFQAKGGCVCGSMRIGVHYHPCAYCDAHPFD